MHKMILDLTGTRADPKTRITLLVRSVETEMNLTRWIFGFPYLWLRSTTLSKSILMLRSIDPQDH
jgi:hypothetical protein